MPIATPADAKRAMNDEVSMPRLEMMTMRRHSHSTTLTMLVRKVKSEGSTLLFLSSFLTNLIIQLMINLPTRYTTTAMSRFLQNVIAHAPNME